MDNTLGIIQIFEGEKAHYVDYHVIFEDSFLEIARQINQLYEPQPDEDEIERDKIAKSNAIGMGLMPTDQCKDCKKYFDCGQTIPPDCKPDQSSRLLTDEDERR